MITFKQWIENNSSGINPTPNMGSTGRATSNIVQNTQKPEVKSADLFKIQKGGTTPEGSKFFDQYKKPDIQNLRNSLLQEYPQIEDLWIIEKEDRITINNIRVDKSQRNKGIGKEIILKIQEYARIQQKPIIIEPEAARGYKKKLETFWKELGFKHNKGRNKDLSLSSMFAPTMIWRP